MTILEEESAAVHAIELDHISAGFHKSWKAARSSMLLSLLFPIIYGALNWATAFRHGVGSWYFDFERHIPFVPVMIIPYLSIDLLYVLAPFVCMDEANCRVLFKRLLLAVVLGAVCFAIYPLRFAFSRPQAPGVLGVAFDLFHQLDQPFNQMPSLHITNLMILAPVYAGRGGKVWKSFVWFWAGLIVVSTVLTYQHHVIDLAGGFALAAVCFYLVPNARMDTSPSNTNPRVAFACAGAAIFVAFVGVALKPIGLLLLWPAISLGILASGYTAGGAQIFRKHAGRLPVSTIVLLWPILLMQRLALLFQLRDEPAWDQLTERVWIGRKLNDAEARYAIACGVSAVVDLTAECAETRAFRGLRYLQLPVLDETQPTIQQLDRGVDFIRTETAPGIVYIHCRDGHSRTAVVAAAFLLCAGEVKKPAEAVTRLRKARPSLLVRGETLQAIYDFGGSEIIPDIETPTSLAMPVAR